MNLTVDSGQLKDLVGFISGNTPNRPVEPILKATHLEAKNDLLTLSATDHIVWAKQSIEAKVKTPGEVYVDAGLLSGIAQSLSEGDVAFSLKKRLTVSQKGKRRSLPPMDGEGFPDEPKPEFVVGWDQPVQSFLYRAEQVGFASSDDMSRPILMGINIDMVNQLMVGADGYRMAIFKTDFEGELKPTFSMRFVQEVKRSGMGGDISISVSETWIRGLSEDKMTVIWAKGLSGAYPTEAAQITKAMLEKEGINLEIEKAGLVQSLGLACLYSDRARNAAEDAILYLVSDKGKLRVEMTVPNVAELKDNLDGKADGDILVKLDPHYFLGVVSHVDADVVNIRFFPDKEKPKPILITDPNNPDWASVLTQMVVREVPKTEEQKVVEKYVEEEEEEIISGDF